MINLINGDAYEEVKKLPEKSVDLVLIDPPYQFDNRKGGGAFGSDKRNYHNEYIELCDNQEVWQKEFDRVLQQGKGIKTAKKYADKVKQRNSVKNISAGISLSILDDLCNAMKHIYIYIWCNKNQLRQYLDYFEDRKCNIDLLVWCKTNPIPTCNNTYLSDVEYCILAREKGCKIYGTYATKHKYYISKTNIEDKKKYKHPTIKPLNIIENLIINSSKEGDTILDCFMGSGTTGVACKKLNRNFIGIELDKEYFEIAKRRIEDEI